MEKIRIGAGAGCHIDRIEPAVKVALEGNIQYLIFECLSEGSLAKAQVEKMDNPKKGYNRLLEYRMEKVLHICRDKGIKIITNMGAANPIEAGKKVEEIAKRNNIKGLKIAVITGDSIEEKLEDFKDYSVLGSKCTLKETSNNIISGNVYLGAMPIVEALKKGADIIIGGRIADPSMFLAPLIYEFNWDENDYDLLGKGTLVGHMLECCAQVTGGFFADPGYKDIKEIHNIGFPIAEVSENGEFFITKVENTGGIVDRRTCTEQLLYEIQNPSEYITPDCIADFSNVEIEEIGPNKVSLKGATGREKTSTLKAVVFSKDYYIGEGQISYGGSGSYKRAELSSEIIEKRINSTGINYEQLKIDYIGYNSLYKSNLSDKIHNMEGYTGEIRLRVVARCKNEFDAFLVTCEVVAMNTNGPSSGSSVETKVTPVVSSNSIYIPREDITANVLIKEV